MAVYSPISTCVKNVVQLRKQISSSLCDVVSREPSSSCCHWLFSGNSRARYVSLSISSSTSNSPGTQMLQAGCFCPSLSSKSRNLWSLTAKGPSGDQGPQYRHEISLGFHRMKVRLLVPKQGKILHKIRCNAGRMAWPRGCATAGVILTLLTCYSSADTAHAESADGDDSEQEECESSHGKFFRGKKVYTDYSVTGIPGDGRCLFRSVAHGACLRSGKPAPNESLQRQLADELRAKVAEEFIKRRQDTEWFIEGDFDTYISQIKKPHVWGGEPELLMASHVLQTPITVYMYDKDAGGLISIAEYGQEYGKENPIRVLYHGSGHYDTLRMFDRKHGKAKL